MKKLISLLIAVLLAFSGINALALEDNTVAVIGETEYSTLTDAYTDAAEGDTIKLVKDISFTGYVGFNLTKNNITFDLNNFSIINSNGSPSCLFSSSTQSTTLGVENITTTFKNGQIKYELPGTSTATGPLFYIRNGTVINIENMNVENSTGRRNTTTGMFYCRKSTGTVNLRNSTVKYGVTSAGTNGGAFATSGDTIYLSVNLYSSHIIGTEFDAVYNAGVKIKMYSGSMQKTNSAFTVSRYSTISLADNSVASYTENGDVITDFSSAALNGQNAIYAACNHKFINNICEFCGEKSSTPVITHEITLDDTVVADIADGGTYSPPQNNDNSFVAYTDGVSFYDNGDAIINITSDISLHTINLEISMISGAAIRYNTPTGLRFYTDINKTQYQNLLALGATVNLGTIISTKDSIGSSQLEHTDKFLIADVPYKAATWFSQSDFEGFVGSVASIKKKNYTRDFIGRGYAQITLGAVSKTIYADYFNDDIANNTRKVAWIAYQIKNSDEYDGLKNAYKTIVDEFAGAYTASTAPNKIIALTFDDGPNTSADPALLDVLEAYEIPAAFFLIGSNITESTSSILQRESALGYEIGNHSYNHKDGTELYEAARIKQEIDLTDALIEQYTGKTTKYFRPPYFKTSQTMFDTVDKTFIKGLSVSDFDLTKSIEDIAGDIYNSVTDGTIILLHDSKTRVSEIVRIIVPELINMGYEFVSLDDLFARQCVTPKHNSVYSTVTLTPPLKLIESVNVASYRVGTYSAQTGYYAEDTASVCTDNYLYAENSTEYICSADYPVTVYEYSATRALIKSYTVTNQRFTTDDLTAHINLSVDCGNASPETVLADLEFGILLKKTTPFYSVLPSGIANSANWQEGFYNPNTGSYELNTKTICVKDYIIVEPSTTYSFTTKYSSNTNIKMLFREYDENGNLIGSFDARQKNTITTSANTKYLSVSISNYASDSTDNSQSLLSLVANGTVTPSLTLG